MKKIKIKNHVILIIFALVFMNALYFNHKIEIDENMRFFSLIELQQAIAWDECCPGKGSDFECPYDYNKICCANDVCGYLGNRLDGP